MLIDRTVVLLASTLTVIAVLWALDIPLYLELQLYTEQFLALTLGLALTLAFLTIRADRTRDAAAPWYDIGAALVAFASCLYVTLSYAELVDELAFLPLNIVVLSSVLLALILEAVRRVAGTMLALLIVLFILYGLFGDLLPGQLAGRGLSFERLTALLVLDPNGVLGAPLKVAASVIIVFVLFGSVLAYGGGTEFFTDLSGATMGRYRGGAAKNSIVASALFGSISGSAVSNVATTGIVTIPLMRRAGFPASAAAGIEAVASTGGQLMPPVMGAAAFLMAEFLEVPYSEVVTAALVPALLYFFSLFVQADLRAARDDIKGVSETERGGSAGSVIAAGWIYLVPFVVLIGALFWLNLNPAKAGLYAIASFLILGVAVLRGDRRLQWKGALQTLVATGHAVLSIVVLTAAAGAVIGLLNYSGLSFGLTLFLAQLSEHNVILLLLVTALISIVLGMGMPTVGVYVLLAALIAPSMVEVGLDKVSVHLFLLYFGMMSMITPPIAIAAFAAAGLAKADPMTTGWQAMKFGWVAYVIPFVFILSPGILLRGDWLGICFAMIGVWFGSIAAVGYFSRRIGLVWRLFFILVALALFWPDGALELGRVVSWAGLAAGAGVLCWLRRSPGRRKAAASAGE